MEVIYNEIDPFAAEWLRNLVAVGELPQGVVNTQSIRDLKGIDCGPTTHLFAGIGGWPLALRLAGWPDDRPVWTGSCPCQPYSAAGKGKGDADERNLWPEMFRLIRECRPPTIFGEQVAAAIGHGWIDGVRADLEKEGYAFGFHVLPACSVGSPNIRQRAFWVADSTALRRQGSDGAVEQVWGSGQAGGNVGLADANESKRGRRSVHDWGRAVFFHAPIGGSTERVADDAEHGRRQGGAVVGRCDCGIRAEGDGGGSADRCDACGLADSECSGVRLPGRGTDGAETPGVQGQDRKRQRVRFDFGASDRPLDPAVMRIIGECGYWPGCERPIGGGHASSCPGRKWGNNPDFFSRVADSPSLPSPERGGESRQELGRQAGPQDAAERGGVGGFGDADSERHETGLHLRRPQEGSHLPDAGRASDRDHSEQGWDDYRIIDCKDGKSRRVGRSVQPLAHGIPVQLRPLFAWLGRLGIDASPLTKMARLARRNRTGRLKGYGNAINPFVAAEFVKAFLAIEFQNSEII